MPARTRAQRKSDAQRQKNRRDRIRSGVDCIIPVPGHDYFGMVDELIDANLISLEASDDLREVGKAIGRFLHELKGKIAVTRDALIAGRAGILREESSQGVQCSQLSKRRNR